MGGRKIDLQKKYKIRDYGDPRSFLSMEVTRDRVHKTLHLAQKAYIQQLAREHQLEDSHSVDSPMVNVPDGTVSPLMTDPSRYRQIVGQIMYCHAATRFDITFPVSQLSRKLARPTEADYKAARCVIQYMFHHQEIGPMYDGKAPVQLLGYSDADYAGDVQTRRSTSGWVFTFMQGPVSKSYTFTVVSYNLRRPWCPAGLPSTPRLCALQRFHVLARKNLHGYAARALTLT